MMNSLKCLIMLSKFILQSNYVLKNGNKGNLSNLCIGGSRNLRTGGRGPGAV